MASQKKPTRPPELLKNKKLKSKTKRLLAKLMNKMLRLTERSKRMMLKSMMRMRARKLKN